jgi:hypothetical protein
MPFCMVSSLNEPVRVPSIEDPLSPQIQMTRVSSSSPIDLGLRRPSLDEVFLALTGRPAEAPPSVRRQAPEEAAA